MSVKSSEDTGKLGYQKCKRKSSLSHCLSATNKVHEICAFEISCASVWFVLCMSHTTGACWYESTNFNLNVFFIFVCQSHNRFICEWAVNVIRKMCVLATNHLPSENNRKRKWRVEQVMVVLWCTLMILKLSFSFHFDEQHRRVCRFSVRFMISILVPCLCVFVFVALIQCVYQFVISVVPRLPLCQSWYLVVFFSFCMSLPTSLLWRRRVTRWNKNIFLPVIAQK